MPFSNLPIYVHVLLGGGYYYFLDEEEKNNRSKTKTQTNEPSDGKTKPVRHAYIHKPFLYSKYYSDSDDERTVEQRRQSIVSLVK